eukprot:5173432-Pyramimonas_sp.AAC.1
MGAHNEARMATLKYFASIERADTLDKRDLAGKCNSGQLDIRPPDEVTQSLIMPLNSLVDVGRGLRRQEERQGWRARLQPGRHPQ